MRVGGEASEDEPLSFFVGIARRLRAAQTSLVPQPRIALRLTFPLPTSAVTVTTLPNRETCHFVCWLPDRYSNALATRCEVIQTVD
jgi:hypothetical protein